jgi:hypothetical protein
MRIKKARGAHKSQMWRKKYSYKESALLTKRKMEMRLRREVIDGNG